MSNVDIQKNSSKIIFTKRKLNAVNVNCVKKIAVIELPFNYTVKQAITEQNRNMLRRRKARHKLD